MRRKLFLIVGCLALSILGLASPASAKPTAEATMVCGSESFTVSGFGRGEALKISGTNTNYVLTYAEVIAGPDTGAVIINVKGQRNSEDIVTCNATSPLSGRTYLYRGFFTPRGTPHEPEL
jgi:hypothetical protein